MFKKFYKMHKKLFWILTAISAFIVFVPIVIGFLPNLYCLIVNKGSYDLQGNPTYNALKNFSRAFNGSLGLLSGLFIAIIVFLLCLIHFHDKGTEEYINNQKIKLQKKKEELNKELNEVTNQINRM